MVEKSAFVRQIHRIRSPAWKENQTVWAASVFHDIKGILLTASPGEEALMDNNTVALIST